MLTTITVNGSEGLRFLASLQETSQHTSRRVPPALVAMIEHVTTSAHDDLEHVTLEVAGPLADEIAEFVEVVSQGHGTPLLFSAQLGDFVTLVRDVLAEVTVNKRESRTWQFLPAGTVTRLEGRKGELGKLQLLEEPKSKLAREYAYVSDRCTTRTRPPR